MLESVILKGGPSETSALDAGILAECLIYYSRVRIILTPGNLGSLYRSLGRDFFEAVVSHPSVDLTVLRGAAATVNVPTSQGIAFGYAIFGPIAKGGHKMADPEFVEHFLYQNSQSKGWSRRIATAIAGKAGHLSLEGKHPQALNITKGAAEDLCSQGLFKRLLTEMLSSVAPAYVLPENWFCHVAKHPGGGFLLDTNLDLKAIEADFLRTHPGEKTLNPGTLVGGIVSLHEDLFVQSQLSGDLQSSDLAARLLQTRVDGAIGRILREREQVAHFQERLMPNGRALREAVNAKEIDFKQVLTLRENRKDFGDWLAGQTADYDLVKQYFNEVNQPAPLGRLPPKPLRFVIFTGLGLGVDALGGGGLGTAMGVAVSAFDTFLFEQLAHGWKPNQFVEKLRKSMNG